ncbi:hypothetical protein [Streptomyces sp. NPDC017260]|uniref:hypothetical protein n=1 Tax=unclassified Streptomyces TaxID=2593676 RepID=UPI0037AEB84D
MPIRIRRFAGTAALVAASALALAGCGDGSAGTGTAAERPASATATPTPTPTPTPTATPASTPSPTPTPTPAAVTLDDHTGSAVGKAVGAAKKAGLAYAVQLQGTGGKRASSWAAGEEVCEQTDDPGGSYDVAFTVPRNGRDCSGDLLHTPEPARTTAPAPDPGTDTGSGTGTDTGSGTGTGGCELTSPAGNCYADGQFCAKKHRGLSTHGRGGEYLTCAQDPGGRWRWSDGVAG